MSPSAPTRWASSTVLWCLSSEYPATLPMAGPQGSSCPRMASHSRSMARGAVTARDRLTRTIHEWPGMAGPPWADTAALAVEPAAIISGLLAHVIVRSIVRPGDSARVHEGKENFVRKPPLRRVPPLSSSGSYLFPAGHGLTRMRFPEYPELGVDAGSRALKRPVDPPQSSLLMPRQTHRPLLSGQHHLKAARLTIDVAPKVRPPRSKNAARPALTYRSAGRVGAG